jgi:DNA-binding MarR family transcriptional regulator
MSDAAQQEPAENARIMLGLLETVDRDGGKSQRRLASELGVAVGLVNAYLKRCIRKGFVKVSAVPARRYVYYLTPQGFAEKSRLTAEYLTVSFSFFRSAKSDCVRALESARAHEFIRVVLAGVSDLTEIAAICAMETETIVVAVVDPDATNERFVGLPVVPTFTAVPTPFDAVIITELDHTSDLFAAAVAHCGVERVIVPELLRGRIVQRREEPQ